MTAFIEAAVPIAEVAKVTRQTVAEVEAEAASLGIYTGHDWAGRPALSAEDANGIVTGRLRHEADERSKWLAHDARLDHWQRARENVRQIAFHAANDESVRRGSPAGVAAADGHEAARLALEGFEIANREPTIDDAPASPSRIAKAAKKIKEAVR